MIRLFATLLFVAVLFPSSKSALSAPVEGGSTLNADQAVREALAANRDLQAARVVIDVARGNLLQAGRLSNPEFSAAAANDSAFRSEGERVQELSISQGFPITARLAHERDVARSDLQIAEAEVREFTRLLVADTLAAFYELVTLARRIDVNDELIAAVRAVEQATERRLRAAEVSPAEVSLLRIERLGLEQEARRLAMERETTRVRLARLMGRALGEPLRPFGQLDPGPAVGGSQQELFDRALIGRPDLILARAEIERAVSDRGLAGAETWQDWMVELSYDTDRQVFDSPIGVKRDTLLRVGVTVPLPLWNRQQGRVAAAAAEIRRARRAFAAQTLRVGEEIGAALARIKALRVGADEYARELLPESARARELLERGYLQGLVGIAELIQAQRQDNDARAFYLELLGDLRQASIDLEAAAAGSPYIEESFARGVTP